MGRAGGEGNREWIIKMSESESDKSRNKTWLSEAVILFLAPALAYFLAYRYEQGYCGTFGLPSYFIKPDLSDILIFVTAAMVYWVCWFWVFDAWLDMGKINPDLRLRPWQHLLKRYSSLFTIFMVVVVLYAEFWRKWIWFLLFLLIFPLLDVISTCLKSPEGKTFTEKWHRTNAWVDDDGLVFRIRSRLGRSGALLFAFVLLGSIFAYLVGNSQALRQDTFLVPSSNTNAIVVHSFGEKFICVVIDPNTKKPTKDFFLLPMTSNEHVEFKLKQVGPLNFQ